MLCRGPTAERGAVGQTCKKESEHGKI
jgi:hypothetical protein